LALVAGMGLPRYLAKSAATWLSGRLTPIVPVPALTIFKYSGSFPFNLIGKISEMGPGQNFLARMLALSGIWFSIFYQPVFNALFWIYNNVAGQNLGWAVVWLTVFLRLVLLPLTLISEHNGTKQLKITEEIARLKAVYKNDSVAHKEEVRKLLRKNYVSPWARVTVLLVQVVVFLLLYQVFVRGISGDKVIKILYSWVEYPGVINTHFYGFDIGS
jgi:hypothetical protein